MMSAQDVTSQEVKQKKEQPLMAAVEVISLVKWMVTMRGNEEQK